MIAQLRPLPTCDFYPAELQKAISEWNIRAAESNTARAETERAIESTRAVIMNGEVSGPQAGQLLRELKEQAMSTESNALKLARESAEIAPRVAAAFKAERERRQAALVTREQELRDGLQKLGVQSRWTCGAINETLHGHRMAIMEVDTIPDCLVHPETLDQIKANVATLL
jgi:hypothetical protein